MKAVVKNRKTEHSEFLQLLTVFESTTKIRIEIDHTINWCRRISRFEHPITVLAAYKAM